MRFDGTQIATMSAAGLALVGSLASGFYTYANRNRELDIRLVEIGIGILRADPKETDLKAARGWAVQVIEDYSKVKFSDADRAALLDKPLLYRPTIFTTDNNIEPYHFNFDEMNQALQQLNKIFPNDQSKKAPLADQPAR
jgi:hypothetical protein